MKKIISLLAVTLFTVSAFAQSDFRTGVRLTSGFSNVTDCNASMKVSYGIGWVAEIDFTKSFYLDSGVNFSMLGMKDFANGAVTGNLNALYAQVPVHFGLKFGSFFIQAGPSVNYGIIGSDIKWSGSRTTNYFDDAKRFDVGVGGRIGLNFGKVQFSVGGEYGVLEVFDNGGHNINYNLGLAFIF